MAKLTEAQAWEVVAMMFDRQLGMCRAVSNLWKAGLVSSKVEGAMHRRLENYRRRNGLHGYWYPLVENRRIQADEPRVKFARAAAERARRKR